MTKKELIKYIEQNTGETENWGELKKLNKTKLERIFEYLEKVNSIENNIDEEEEEEEKEKKVIEKIVFEISSDEYMEHKLPSKLSKDEQSMISRIGFSRKIKNKKYDRFDDEDVKFGF